MDRDDEHASFLSTISFPPPGPDRSELALVNPADSHSQSTVSPSLTEKPPDYRASAKSSDSRQNRTKYESVSNSSPQIQVLYDNWVVDSWLLEILSLGLALVSMGALVVILAIYQNKALPHWRWGLTLNSVLSIFSQLTTLSMTCALAGALSQQKWLWFRKPGRTLKDFGCFDDASKGPWGCLVLLFSKSRIFHVGALGAVALLLVQAFQPFIQQVVTYPSRWEAAQYSNATIYRTTNFTIVDGARNNVVRTYVSNPIKAGVYNGLYDNEVSLSDVVPISCPSGTCSWQPHSTLAICAYVADVSAFIQTHTYSSTNNSITTFYTLPTGGFLAAASQNMSLVSTDNSRYLSLAFQNTTQAAVLNNFYTFFFSNQTGNPTLLETSLQLCVKTLNTTVTDGQTEVQELSRFTTIVEDGGHQVIVPNDVDTYIMADYSFNDLSLFLASIFIGNYTTAVDGAITFSSDAIEVLVGALIEESPYDQAAMAIFLNGFTASITNALRSNSAWSIPFNGTLYLPQTYVSVSWPWLTLPIFLIIMSSCFLLITIMETRARGFEVWKGSGLAGLQGLGDEAREAVGKGLDRVSGMEKRAEDVEVRLRREQGGRWVLQ